MCLVATWPPARPCVAESGDRCQFCSCAFKLVVGHVRQQADSEQSTFAKHGGETNAKNRGVRRIGVSWTVPIRNTCARIRTRSGCFAPTSARADFSSGCQCPMKRMSAEQGRLNVLLGGAALHLGKLFGEASIGAQQAPNSSKTQTPACF